MATIEIIDRSNNRVVDTHYNAFYHKFYSKKQGKWFISVHKIVGKGRMKGNKTLGTYDLNVHTWRFK